jgi:cell division transport system ATP-binding protein
MIQLFHVSKTYPPNYRALTDITLEIKSGEMVFLAGPSGAGKSTLLKLLFREEEPTEGQILIAGKNVTRLSSHQVARLRRKLGLVFQEVKLLPYLTVLDNVALAAEVIGISKKASRAKAYQLLRELGLKERYDSKPMSLSGGERQRVAIARALVNDPMLVLADEPTGNLDADVAAETMRLLFEIRDKGATIVVATHDLNLINRYGSRVILLQHGELTDDVKLVSCRERGK